MTKEDHDGDRVDRTTGDHAGGPGWASRRPTDSGAEQHSTRRRLCGEPRLEITRDYARDNRRPTDFEAERLFTVPRGTMSGNHEGPRQGPCRPDSDHAENYPLLPPHTPPISEPNRLRLVGDDVGDRAGDHVSPRISEPSGLPQDHVG